MKIKNIKLTNFKIFESLEVDFRDFNMVIGNNGIGKTTLLNAVSLLCSSLDYQDPFRQKAALIKNIKNYATKEQSKGGFCAKAVFEHDKKDYEVILTQDGWFKNEILDQPWWNASLVYFARFDVDNGAFQLKKSLWPKFKKSYENIMGFTVDPDIYKDTDLELSGEECEIVTGFFLNKPQARSHLSNASGGERKVAKSLGQIVNLPQERLPHIIIADEIERQVDYRRHLNMIDEVKEMFKGMQIISTTHSETLRRDYHPKYDVIDLEKILGI